MGADGCVIAGFSYGGWIHRNSQVPAEFMEPAETTGFDAPEDWIATVAPDRIALQIKQSD
jgi:hypothetical protein